MPATPEAPAEIRRQRMTDYVGEREYVRVAELGDQFGVSEVTIRTDLAAMERAGFVRVRGFAGAGGFAGAREFGRVR